MRDLGAHLTLSGVSAGVTLTARSSRAATALDRIRSLPIPAAKKATLIRGKAYAMGLYGVEGTPLNVSQGRMLRAKAADALVGKHQTMRSPEAALALVTAKGLDLDTEVLWRRIRLLRRAWHVRPSWQQLIQQDYDDTLRWVQSLHTEGNGEGALGEGRSGAGIPSKRGVRAQLKKGPISRACRPGPFCKRGSSCSSSEKESWTSCETPFSGCGGRSWTAAAIPT